MRKSQRSSALRRHFSGGRNEHEVLENEILVSLSQRPYVVVWKNETGAVPIYRKNAAGGVLVDADGQPVVERYIHYGKVGSGDLSGIVTVRRGDWQLGVRLEVEVKTGSGRQSEEQSNFEQMILSRGGLYVLARDVATCCETIDNFSGWNV